MVAQNIKPSLRTALRAHEIGSSSPYELDFAAKGKSGGSFGFMQGDLAAAQPEVTAAFRKALADFFQPAEIDALIAKLSVPCPTNPLTPEQTKAVNKALDHARPIVDAMDETILAKLYPDVDKCTAIASEAHRKIDDEALIYMALWINMTGPPTKLLKWLAGEDPSLPVRPADAPAVVDVAAIQGFLLSTTYYRQNPKNFKHMKECVAIGAAQLPA